MDAVWFVVLTRATSDEEMRLYGKLVSLSPNQIEAASAVTRRRIGDVEPEDKESFRLRQNRYTINKTTKKSRT